MNDPSEFITTEQDLNQIIKVVGEEISDAIKNNIGMKETIQCIIERIEMSEELNKKKENYFQAGIVFSRTMEKIS